MKKEKYRYFSVLLIDGTEVEIKTYNAMTEIYCKLLAYHLVNKQNGLNLSPSDVVSVKESLLNRLILRI